MSRSALVAMLVFAVVAAVPQGGQARQTPEGVDFLGTGVTITGAVTFERKKQDDQDMTLFFIGLSSDTSAAVRLSTKFVSDSSLVSSLLYQRLLPGGQATIRLADRADMSVGTVLRSDLLAGILTCNPEPSKRDGKSVSYILRCVNLNSERWAKNDGKPAWEVDLVVSGPTDSPVDRFLTSKAVMPDAGARLLHVRVER